MKKILQFGASLMAVGVFFLWAYNAEARIQSSRTESGFSMQTSTNAIPGFNFTANYTGTLSTIEVYLAKGSGEVNFSCQAVVDVPRGVNNGYGTVSQTLTSESKTLFSFVWNNSPPVVAGTDYYISLSCTGSKQIKIYGDENNAPASVCFKSSNHGTTCNNDGTTMKHWYYVVNDNVTTSTIEWLTTPATTTDFTDWLTTVQLEDGADTTDYDVAVCFGSASTTNPCIYTDRQGGFDTNDELAGFFDQTFPKRSPLVEALQFWARAYLYDTTDPDDQTPGGAHEIARSSLWHFTVVAGATSSVPGISLITVTSTTAGDNLTCDPTSSFFATSMCHLFLFLFYPSQSILDRFANLKTDLSAKPPFGYVTVYKTELDTLVNSSTSATSTVDMSSLSQYTVFGTIRTILSWFLYFMFGWWIFNRLRRFSLHG